MPWGILKSRDRLRLSLAAAFALCFASHAFGQARIMPVGILPGAQESAAYGVSADGRVVYGTSDLIAGTYHAFRWTAANGIEDLGNVPGTHLQFPCYRPYGASSDGTTIVGLLYDPLSFDLRSFRWTLEGGMEDLNINVDANDYSSANGVSGDGSVIVGGDSYQGGFRWQNGEIAFPWPTGAMAISRDGLVVVTRTSVNGVTHVVRWTEAGESLDVGAFTPTAISEDGGLVVGDSLGSPFHGMRWAMATGLLEMGGLGVSTSPVAMNADGSVVVGSAQRGEDAALIWVGSNPPVTISSLLQSLGADLTGWNLLGASGISSDGSVIAGTGTFAGEQVGWVAWLHPQCTSADFDHDGTMRTDADIEAFFRCLAGVCCQTCDSADADGNGDVGTDADIEAFFRVLAGQPC